MNVIALLTEGASVKYATPVYVEPNEISFYGKGLSEYKKSINMPMPWTGGWWRLSDLVEYEVVSTLSMLKTSSIHKIDILKYRYTLCRKETEKGQSEAPFYYILPRNQHDQSELVNLVQLLQEHNIAVHQLIADVEIKRQAYRKGDIVVTLSQTFRPFIKEVMEKQKFPVRHYTPNGKVIKPEDIASWSLPLHRGVESVEINVKSAQLEASLTEVISDFAFITDTPDNYWGVIFSASNNESFAAAFKAVDAGLATSRTVEALQVGEVELSSGSFVIQAGSKLDPILDGVKVSPVFVDEKPGVKTKKLQIPRIAMMETFFHDMDAGWTRFIFENYNLPFTVIHPGDVKTTDFKKFAVVVFTDVNKNSQM